MKYSPRGVLLLLGLTGASHLCAQSNTFPSSGSAGVGTTSPSRQLHVYGAAQAVNDGITNSGNTGGTLYLQDTGGSAYNGGTLIFGAYQGFFGGIKGVMTDGTSNTAGDLSFETRNATSDTKLTSRMTIKANGNVGIGTTSPGLGVGYVERLLDVEGAGSAGISVRATSTGGREYLWYADTGGLFQLYDATSGASRMAINESGNVGIGTSTPAHKLQVYGTGRFGADAQGFVDIYNTPSEGGTINLRSTEGVNMYLENISGYFRLVNSAWTYELFKVDQSGNAYLRGNVGIGTNPGTYKLAVLGAIRAQEIVVDTGWSDYVFDDDYRLASLSEVEAHIKTKKHLPGIPSATEVAERGVSVGEMQSKLLAKIEELTLHQIEQEKKIQALSAEVSELRKREPR